MSVNKAGREEHFLLDKTEDQVKEWNYWNCIEKAYHDLIKDRIAAAMRNEKTGSFVFKHVPGTSDGIWCRGLIEPVRGEKGDLELLLFISQNITKEVEAETLKKTHVEELEKFNNIMVGRELRIIELKNEIENLQEKIKILEAGKQL